MQGQRLQRQCNAALGRAGQGQQLVHGATGALLGLGDAFDFAAPDGRVVVCQRMGGLGADACEGGAQLVRHIARKFALRMQALLHARQQAVQGHAQALHVAGAGLLRQRRRQGLQVGGVALVHGVLQSPQRVQVALYAAQQP